MDSRECQGGEEAGCQTEIEIITRAQCESLMMDAQTKYMDVLMQATTQMKEQMETIQSLQVQLREKGGTKEPARIVGAQFPAGSGPCVTMECGVDRDGEGHLQESQDWRKSAHTHARAPDLQALREEHTRQRTTINQKRREERQRREERLGLRGGSGES